MDDIDNFGHVLNIVHRSITWTRKQPGYHLCANNRGKSRIAMDTRGFIGLVVRTEEKWRVVEV